MKRTFFCFAMWVAAIYLCPALYAQTSHKAIPYFTTKEMPDMLRWYPTPPEYDSDAFALDIKKYYWGKEMRMSPERAAIAINDAHYGLSTIISIFSVPFGLQISEKHTPEIYTLLRDALATTDSICTIPKAAYMRPRPFMYFSEHTLTPEDEPSLRKNGSYPSGHSILGFASALLLSEINPEAADTLLARGLMYAESRIIVGAHWQSDVNAGIIAASVAYMKLHTSERFIKQMKAAREEFSRLAGSYPPVKNIASTDSIRVRLQQSIETIESRYDCIIQRIALQPDDVTGLRMVFVKTRECPEQVRYAVDHILLVNNQDEVVYVVKALVRHDLSIDGHDSLYALSVIGEEQVGEILLSELEYNDVNNFLLQWGYSPELINCSAIRSVVSPSPLVPLHNLSEEKVKIHQRFFGR